MTLLLAPAPRPRAHPSATGRDLVVPFAALAVVAVRLPWAGLPLGADEAGYLQVGAQWSGPGRSLYTDYWVDRPPLLVGLFRLAALAGGTVPLRLLGCLAVAAVVLLVAWSARQVGGARAGRWAGVTAAALLVSPTLDAFEVNGELLAAPFVALGTGAAIRATRARSSRAPDGRVELGWAVLAGAAAVAALLVKQNMADVVVLGAALVVAGLLSDTLDRRTAGRLVGGALLGAVATLALAALVTASRGTSPGAVYEALYPFRLRAAEVVAAAGSHYAAGRLSRIGLAWLGSGLALLTGSLVVATLRSRLREPVLVALAVTAVFDLASVALGGAYWLHYLVQLVVPLSIGAGVAAATAGRTAPTARHARPSAAVGVCVLTVALALGPLALHRPGSRPAYAEQVGEAIGAVASPGDTLVTLYGEPEVGRAAGLGSPYQHLWSLPVKTLDPGLRDLDAVLGGPRAPTWVVTTHGVATWGLRPGAADATRAVLDARYRPVAAMDGHTVYLLDTVHRAVPAAPDHQEHP